MGWERLRTSLEGVRGQVSVEYLAVIGISVMMLIPLFLLFSQQTLHFDNQINTAHLERTSFELLNAAEEVYLLGPPSTMQLRVTFPKHVDSVLVEPTGFTFNLTGSTSPILFSVDSQLPLNLTGTVASFQGLHVINMTATTTGVVVGEVR